MEIKSSLLQYSDFKELKNSIINISKIDNKLNFRVKLSEYINDTADNNDDLFFFEMLPFLRFLNPKSKAIAYTTPEHLIYLNSPGDKVGENVRIWDFIYCHECLHQLWDTFEVGNKIKKEGLEYDHEILNIASDCVINDYLERIRKKTPFANGIFPETIRKEFGVDYDPQKDTQYSLYVKLMEVKKQVQDYIKNNPDLFVDPTKKIKPNKVEQDNSQQDNSQPDQNEDEEKVSDDYRRGWCDAIKDVQNNKVNPLDPNLQPKATGNDEYDQGYNDCMVIIIKGMSDGVTLSNSSSPSNSNNGDGLPEIPWDIDNDENEDTQSSNSSNSSDDSDSQDNNDETPQESANRAKKAAQKAQKNADAAKEKANKSGSDEDVEDAEAAQEVADEAKEAAEAAQQAADEAKAAEQNGDNKSKGKAAKEAKDEADKAEELANNTSKKQSKGKPGNEHVSPILSDIDLDKIRKNAEAIINKHKNRISGKLNDFIKKCVSSSKVEKNGIQIDVVKGHAGWDTQMNKIVNAYIKKRVFQKRRQYERTYSRVKRGSGFIEFGKPIDPGKKIKEDKLTINIAFYIDRSGSMSGSIDNVFKSLAIISQSIKKHYHKEKIVDDIAFKLFAFDTDMIELKFGKKCSVGGGTMSLNEILASIEKNTKDYLINIIITDGQFDIDKSNVKHLLKNIEGIALFITNSPNFELKQIAKENADKFHYIEANSTFMLDK